MEFYYMMRNIFLILFLLFTVISIAYGIHIHIIVILQKNLGIEKRREIARMREGTYQARSRRFAESSTKSQKINAEKKERTSPPIDMSRVQTEPLKQDEMQTAIISDPNETVVLSDLNETVVLQDHFRAEKDIIVVHGEDIL